MSSINRCLSGVISSVLQIGMRLTWNNRPSSLEEPSRPATLKPPAAVAAQHQIPRSGLVQRFCRDALALHARLFRLWHRFRDGPGVRYGPITREQLIAKSIPLEKKFFALADRYLDSRDKDVANLALALLQHFERFFAFLRHEGVEPT